MWGKKSLEMSWQQIANSCSRGRWLTDEVWVNWNHIQQEIKILYYESGMGGGTAGNPQGLHVKITFMLYHLLWCPKALGFNYFFSSHFLFKVSKITWQRCPNPLEFSIIVFLPQDVCYEVCVSAGVHAQRSQDNKGKCLYWGPGCQFSCRQGVWCCGHIQKALSSHGKLTIGSVYFKCCHRGVLHLSNLILTSLCRTCSLAKTYHGILTCTRSN